MIQLKLAWLKSSEFQNPNICWLVPFIDLFWSFKCHAMIYGNTFIKYGWKVLVRYLLECLNVLVKILLIWGACLWFLAHHLKPPQANLLISCHVHRDRTIYIHTTILYNVHAPINLYAHTRWVFLVEVILKAMCTVLWHSIPASDTLEYIDAFIHLCFINLCFIIENLILWIFHGHALIPVIVFSW